MKFYAGCLLHYNTFQGLKKVLSSSLGQEENFLAGQVHPLALSGKVSGN